MEPWFSAILSAYEAAVLQAGTKPTLTPWSEHTVKLKFSTHGLESRDSILLNSCSSLTVT